ncbi:dihydrodipicolinate synthase family protein [Actinoplanes sp. CA-030573]|uniref:dihydrodipicolinate synthase family protein n=1 Tax=Actinoplanes sp. CA-030573 TaxID=3239898 RepID=UPI003D8EF1F4
MTFNQRTGGLVNTRIDRQAVPAPRGEDSSSSLDERPPVAGVLTVFQTPFDGAGRIDHEAMSAQFDWLFANGADGVVFAMVSEVLRLSSEERDEVAALTCKLANGRGASVISVGAESVEVAVRHARHAQAVGADAIMATPPGLVRAVDDELERYFLTLAGQVDIPLIVQDASGYVGTPLSIDMQARLHAQLGDRVMFKPEAPPIGPRLTRLMDATGGRARVFEGTGGLYLIDSYRRGVVGTMPAGDLVWALSALWKALEDNDYARAYRIAGPLALMVSLQTSLDSFIAIEKHLLVKQGVFTSAAMRGPLADGIDDQTREEIERLMALLREVVDGE